MGRDGFDPARAQVFQPLERFGSPSAADIRIGEWVKAFYQAVCQKCARVARQGERGLGYLFDGNAHGSSLLPGPGLNNVAVVAIHPGRP